MTRRTALIFLWLLSSLSFGQAERLKPAFPDGLEKGNPTTSWIFNCTDAMEKSGALVGFPDVFHGRPPTRYEIAVAVHATYVHARNILRDKVSTGQRTNAKNALPCLQKMTAEFTEELSSLGVDVPDMLLDLQKLAGSQWTIQTRGIQRSEANRWIFRAFEDLSRDKLTSIYDSQEALREVVSEHPTNVELALATHHVVQTMRRMLRNQESSDRKTDLDTAYSTVSRHLPTVEKLVTTFSPELTALGLEPAKARGDIQHWKEVESLRSLRISKELFREYQALVASPSMAGTRFVETEFEGWRPETRYEAAVCTYAMYSQAMDLSRNKPSVQIPEARNLWRLLYEFKGELHVMDIQDVDGVIAKAQSLCPTIEVRKLGTDSKDAWVLDDIKSVLLSGALTNFPSLQHHKPTNYDVANAIKPTIDHMQDLIAKLSEPKCQEVVLCTMLATGLAVSMDSMQRLIREFTPELRAIDVDPNDLRNQIKEARKSVEALWSPDKVGKWNLSAGYD